MRLDGAPSGDLGTCLYESVDGRFEIILPALFFLSFDELFYTTSSYHYMYRSIVILAKGLQGVLVIIDNLVGKKVRT